MTTVTKTNEFINPFIEQRADPFMMKHTDGYYYFTASVPEYDGIELRRSKTIDGLRQAETKKVWLKHDEGEMSANIWAPEIHYIDGKWYIYFAAGRVDDIFAIRMYALECDAKNPLEGEWKELGRIKTKWDSFALDATTFEHKGIRYYVWAQKDPEIEGNTNLYIAKLLNPWTVSDHQVMITTPDRDWECIGFLVNEGPAVLKKNGKIFIAYSASATDHNYCMGLLTVDENADLLDPNSWVKSDAPVFSTCEEHSQYGPGHNSFVKSEDDSEDLMVYHARNYKEIEGDPLYDPNRHTRIKKVEWDEFGNPVFGVPMPDTKKEA